MNNGKPRTIVKIIIATGGPVPTQIISNSVHSRDEVKMRYKNAWLDSINDKPALFEVETGEETSNTLFFPVNTIMMLSVEDIPVKPMIEIAPATAVPKGVM